MPKPTKETAIRRLQQQLDVIPELNNLRYDSPEFTEWRRNTRVAIANTFEAASPHIDDFGSIRYARPYMQVTYAHLKGLEEAAAILSSMITEVEEYWEESPHEISLAEAPQVPQPVITNRVFLIHGRDHGTRDAVARFLEKLGLEPVILEEQPNRGRTVIEKFEEHVQGDFAVALLTPDDVGGLSNDELQPRARQNVIFEFGYCIGKFGRDRVLALVNGDPEIPSDYAGVLYIRMDETGGWQMRLIREMNSVGFKIDANLAL